MSGAFIATLAAPLLAEDDGALLAGLLAAGTAEGALEAARLAGEAADPAALLSALDGAEIATPADRALGLVMRCFAALRLDYPARQEAEAMRAAISGAAEPAYAACGEAYGHAVLDWLVLMTAATVTALSAIAASRAPLVRVETGLSLPSALVAWDLYGDPGRGAEIAARNRCGTPMLLPAVLEALAG